MHRSKALLAAILSLPLLVNAAEPAKADAKADAKPAEAAKPAAKPAGSGADVAGVNLTFFGSAKIKPTYYGNLDFNQQTPDVATLNEGGFASGEHLRAELRLGAQATGSNWKFKMILESDLIMEKDTADRSFYNAGTSPAGTGTTPNAGAEFGIERAEFLYGFNRAIELETGWELRAADIKTGGLVFGDDHPFLGFRGSPVQGTSYELLYIPIQNRDRAGVRDLPRLGDWRVYMLKVDQTVGPFNVSPFLVASDFVSRDVFNATTSTITSNPQNDARAYYAGLELTGKLGRLKPSAEFAAVTGKFRNDTRIKSFAGYAGAEYELVKTFVPYAAVRYTRGDKDRNDRVAKGFVGITDIGRFTPLMGMDGNILSEHLSSGASIYNSPLYSYSPDRAVGGNLYGGIGGASSGNNPGQRLVAVGARGGLDPISPKLSYKAQAFFIWYDETGNLANVKTVNTPVDRYAGTTADLQLKYAFNKNFSVDYISSFFFPGAGIEDQLNSKDLANIQAMTIAWAF
jgi:hypothetical protein